LEVLW